MLTMNNVTPAFNLNRAERKTNLIKLTQASVSHDMRAPNKAITMMTKRLINPVNNISSEDLTTRMKAIHGASKMMGFLMDDLLDS